MTKLKAKEPKSIEPSKPKIIIYGKPGVGKTWVSLDFPSVYFIDPEAGADLDHYQDKLKKSGGVYMGQDEGSLDFNEVTNQVKALTTEKHRFKTLVIDSISKLYNHAASEAAEKGGDDFGRDKKEANKPMRRLLTSISRLDMTVIFIAHETPVWGGSGKERSVIGSTFDCYQKLEYELHLGLWIVKQGSERTAIVKKTRLLGFPDGESFQWSYAEFAKRYGKDVIEREAKPLELASKEQTEELNRLIDLLKIEQEIIDKWLERANAETVAELNTEQTAKIIESLKSKIK